MAKTKAQKQVILDRYHTLLNEFDSFILLDTLAIPTRNIEGFKKKLAENNAKYFLLKNTLFVKALKVKKIPVQLDEIKGLTGGVFAKGDPNLVLKNIMAFLTENKEKGSKVKNGIIDNTLYNAQQVEQISKLPSKLQLIAQLIGTMKSPMVMLAGTLNGVQQKLVYTLKSIEATK